jgi:hypothetical protein
MAAVAGAVHVMRLLYGYRTWHLLSHLARCPHLERLRVWRMRLR